MVELKDLQKEVMRNKIEKGFNTTDMALDFCRAHEELSEAFSKFTDGITRGITTVLQTQAG